jgi:hypothetical protein
LPALLAPLTLRLSRPLEQTPPQGAAALRLVFGTDNCINAISAPKNGSSTATLGVKVIVKGMNLQIQVDVKTHRRKHEDNDAEI